jgi:hypothetical protein
MKVQVFVRDKEIDLNPFTEGYVGNVLSSIAASLKGVQSPRRIEFSISGGRLAIISDGVPVQIAGFAELIAADTVAAVLKHLKGFSPDDPVRITIEL